MNAKYLRGVAAALLIGTATVAAAGVSTVSVAEAAGVRPEVGKPLQEAIGLAKSGKGSAAMAKVREAEGVKGLSSAEQKAISQTKEYVAVTTGNFSGGVNNATTAKAKFAADYRAGRYHDVVGQDAEYLKKYGVFDANSQLIVAQAYYQSGQYRAAMKYLDSLGSSAQVVQLKLAVAAKLGDTDAQADAAEALVLRGESKYWPYLFAAADHAPGLSDESTLGIYRVRLLTGNMRNADDYSVTTQIAIQLGYPQEGLAVQQKGFDEKVLSGARQERLLALAKKQAAEQAAKMPAMIKQAQAAKDGDPLLKIAEIQWGMGKYQDAKDSVEAALQKGVKDEGHAQIVLGMADTGLKKTSEAVHALAKVKDPKEKVVAHLWSVYARTK